MSGRRQIGDADYTRLLTVRTALRQFERWSAAQATGHGLTASQHQLMLAIRGHPGDHGPTISEAAEYLLIRQHSAVELADRSEAAGLIIRTKDSNDHRAVRLQLSAQGARTLEALTSAHLEEIDRLIPLFESMIDTLTIP
ncbi:DNA-binding transcriptional regulator, MarR family [Nakamurella panacisegetis]|uniref:DNA-binding transcriptional regulator, MarR family n=1 Tax=Nakamurella panacisegetis TaxID=1090615 RepID=A0A1H0RJA2_9ACTN|nr:MarR family transcriptional regulator [Nakamurella panacisegetis]SDP29289.1 DNA-binding transcriptional regulator, MarR family [Nakamurella panacisegetis]